MRNVSSATVAMILGVALYFTLFWGFDALRMLTSPTYGLEDVWRSQIVFGLGRVFGLAPMGLLKLDAFFATLKLAVAAIGSVFLPFGDKDMLLGDANLVIDVLLQAYGAAHPGWPRSSSAR